MVVTLVADGERFQDQRVVFVDWIHDGHATASVCRAFLLL
jgi:hypothetical protein